MRWLVTGAAGMLGRDLCATLAQRGHTEVTAATRADLDLLDTASIAAAVTGHDVVVNCAAWTDVDGAESHEAASTAINGHAVADLATACARSGAALLQISSDYVFAGNATTPYPEDAPLAPVNAYGRGKAVGEQAVLGVLPERGYVIRTAWLYATHSRNFVTTMLRLARERDTVDVVDDQLGQPTWTVSLSHQLITLGEQAARGHAQPGVYHGTSAGQGSWYDLAGATYQLSGFDAGRVRRTSTANFPRPAARPAYSVLAHGRWQAAGVASQPDWRVMLAQALSTSP